MMFQLRCELWQTARRDRERAETIAVWDFPLLGVDQGQVILDARHGSLLDLPQTPVNSRIRELVQKIRELEQATQPASDDQSASNL